ncbi:MAG: hypothetical protein GYA41_04770 [Bacteroidales bacterium]|nr:hypothetical protein [Bacteroidales bacterium]
MKRNKVKLWPHHIIDIVTDHGNNIQHRPHPYGHSQHLIAPLILSDPGLCITLVVEADEICKGCRNLLPDGRCKDVLGQLHPSPSKQAYNDVLDCRLLDHFGLMPGRNLTAHDYLQIVNSFTPGVEKICTHPKEDPEDRLAGLKRGLMKLGLRNDY